MAVFFVYVNCILSIFWYNLVIKIYQKGKKDYHEVYAPKGLVGEGMRFESSITNNMANGSYRGQSFHMSTIQAIHSFPESEDQKMQNLRI